MDSGNEIECPSRGNSPYFHAYLWGIIMHNYFIYLFIACVEFIL